MNWRKYWLGMGHDENTNEIETNTDDEVSESDETVSTEKSSRNIGVSSSKSFYKCLPKECLKFSFLLLNSVALLAGVTAITISVWMLTSVNSTSRLFGQRLSLTILLILGVFVSFVALTGIIGIAKKREYFMVVYLISQSIALCAVFISLTMSFPFFDMITKMTRNDMINFLKNYQSLNWAAEAWDNTHKYLKCCGIRSSKDWLDYQMNIPQSCCSTLLKQVNLNKSH